MKRNDSKKVDRLVHPLCQHLLVYIVSLQPCFSWVEKSGVQHQQKLHSTELLLLHIADSSIGAGRCQSVCLLFYHSLFPTPDTHTQHHPLHKWICHPAYTTVPFLTVQLCVSVHVSVWVCVSTCMCVSQSYKFLTLQKMFLFSVP